MPKSIPLLGRNAAQINFATKKFMSVLSKDATFAQLLSAAPALKDNSSLPIFDINTLTGLLRQLLLASGKAQTERQTKKSRQALKLPENHTLIPLRQRGAAGRIQAIAKKYQLRGEPTLGCALAKIYFDHRDELLLPISGAKAFRRSAAKINLATKKFMSALSTYAMSAAAAPADKANLPIGDIKTLKGLLRRLLLNSAVAKQSMASRGRGRNPLPVTVAAELGQLYDKCCPPSSLENAPRRNKKASVPRPRSRTVPPRRRLAPSSGRVEGESRSNIRERFVHEAAGMLGVKLAESSIRTYREKKHTSRVVRSQL